MYDSFEWKDKEIWNGKLWSSIDNWGLMRGTRNLNFSDSNSEEHELVDRVDWKQNLKNHWDVNPWVYTEQMDKKECPPELQGLVSFVDSPIEVGGLRILPGSNKHLKTWCKEHRCLTKKHGGFKVDEKDPLNKYLQKIPLRKGELVIWNVSCLHGTFPNDSPNMRIYQFIRLMPSILLCQWRDRHSPGKIWKQMPEEKIKVEKLKNWNQNEKDLFMLF